MNFKKTWKRFFSLNRHHAEGFTLVELIVVIAILAILGGVAVPAYSGYVEKANKAADISLVSEIEHALTLAYYNGDLDEGDAGFLMLSPDSPVQYDDNAEVDTAMANSFGSNWAQNLHLEHNNWGVKNMLVSYDDASAVVNSNFVQKYSPDELMEEVKKITQFADALNATSEFGGLYDKFNYADGSGNTIEDVIKDYFPEGTKYEDLTPEEKSNVMVLATAKGMEDSRDFAAESLLTEYAVYVAYAKEGNESFNSAFNAFSAALESANDPNNGKTAEENYNTVKEAYKTFTAQATNNSGFVAWQSQNNNGANTQDAFSAVMSGVSDAMKDDKDKIMNDLGNADTFVSGAGNELYKDYLNTAYATAGGSEEISEGMTALAEEGAVFVQYNVVNGVLYVANSLPVS